MKSYKEHHQEVEDKLRLAKRSDKESKFKDLKKYIGTSYEVIGLSVPKQRDAFKQGYSFTTSSSEAQLDIWEHLWQMSPVYEVMSQSLLFIGKNIKKFDEEFIWDRICGWVKRVDNWAHSDSLSGFYSYLLERNPELVFPQLKEWNSSANPWERRQSLVSLIEYHKKRKTVLPASSMFPLVTHLLSDKDYFVQKGLGWALREIGNVYPGETWTYLESNCSQIAPAAFTAAIEKLSPPDKEKLKKIRKDCRKK